MINYVTLNEKRLSIQLKSSFRTRIFDNKLLAYHHPIKEIKEI